MKKIFLFFAIMMMAITASARDVVFTGNDTWLKNNSTKTITCTKGGVTLSLSGDNMIPDPHGDEIVFRGSTATITVDAGTATVTGVSVTGEPEFNNFDLTGAGPWTCPIYMHGLKPDNASSGLDFVQGFTVHVQDPTPTGDVVFTGNDTWSKNNSTKTITCTKGGVTLSLSGDNMIPDPHGDEIVFRGSTATITVDAGTATVTGVSVTGEPEFNNFDLTGAGPWTCPIYLHGLKPENASSGLDQVTGFTVHIGFNVTLNSAGYATFSCNTNTKIDTEGVKAYKASVDGETITLTQLTGYISAGTGVILYSEDPSAIVTLSVAASGDAAADVSGNALKATTKADGSLATLEANSWALGDNQEFLHFTGDAYIYNRAYLVHVKPAGAKAMRMVFAEGETTGIDATLIDTATREGKFLDGSKIVIIKNGTKYNVAGQVIK